jgi:hypothetical protein
VRTRVALVTTAAALAAAPAATAEPTPSQKLFRDTVVKDRRTTAEVRSMLRTHTGFVDRRSGYADVTGDGRADALVLVTTGGAAGTVALYVLSTHGQTGAGTKLRAALRLQRLHGATLQLHGTTITVTEPRWAPGDDLCCPAQMRERDYAFAPARRAFVRTADRVVDGPGAKAAPGDRTPAAAA